MAIIKLIHPELGVVAEKKLASSKGFFETETAWRYKYGKKFFECKVEKVLPHKLTPEEKPLLSHQRKLINIKTGEIYENQKAAAKALNLDQGTILNHLKKKLKGRFSYIVKYAD